MAYSYEFHRYISYTYYMHLFTCYVELAYTIVEAG